MAFDMKTLKRQKKYVPPRILVYAGNRLGKSTLCASAPRSILIPTEPISDEEILAENSFSQCTTLEAVLDAITVLLDQEHEFETVCIDSADWLDKLINEHVCRENKWETIDSVKFNKEGHQKILACWNEVLEGLNALRLERGMMVILTCKEAVRTVQEVFGEPYTQFYPALSEGGAGMKDMNPLRLVCDWCDVVGLIRHNVETTKVKSATGKKDSKAVVQKGDCARLLHLEEHPAYLGGSRYSQLKDMPFDNPFDWESFMSAIKNSR